MEAGNDLLMPGKLSQREEIKKAVLNGRLSMEIIDRNVKHILEYILKTPRYKGYVADNNPDLKAHALVTRNAALEGMVLLKNLKSTLPIKQNVKNVAVFGRTSYDFIAGGTGSGDVNHAYVVSLIDGLKNAGFNIDNSLKSTYEAYIPEATAKMPKSTSQELRLHRVQRRRIRRLPLLHHKERSRRLSVRLRTELHYIQVWQTFGNYRRQG